MKTFKFSLVLRTRENTDVFITLDDNIYGIHSKRVNILYLFYFLHANARFWRHICRHQTKHERHGVDVQCLTCETLESQNKTVSANQNNIDIKVFLTF